MKKLKNTYELYIFSLFHIFKHDVRCFWYFKLDPRNYDVNIRELRVFIPSCVKMQILWQLSEVMYSDWLKTNFNDVKSHSSSYS